MYRGIILIVAKKSNLLWNTYSIRSTRKSKTPNKTKQTRKAEGKKKEDTVVSSTTHDLLWVDFKSKVWEREWETKRRKKIKRTTHSSIVGWFVLFYYYILIFFFFRSRFFFKIFHFYNNNNNHHNHNYKQLI